MKKKLQNISFKIFDIRLKPANSLSHKISQSHSLPFSFSPFLLLPLILLSCSDPKLDNPFDTEYSLPAPSNLNIAQLSFTSCKLTWTDNSTGEQGFRIDRQKDSDNWQIDYAEVGENVTEFDETNLSINSSYSYRVYGFADENTSSAIENSIDSSIPAPENLTYTLENISYPSADINLDWDYSMSGIDGFKVKKNGTLLSTIIPAGTTEWTDVAVNIDNSYSYQVLAFIQSNNSAYSNEVEVVLTISGMIFVQGGTFEMGDHFNEGGSDELPLHNVTLDECFIGEHEVTNTEYIEFLNDFGVSSNGSYNGTELIDMDDSDCAIDHNGSFYFGGSSYAASAECPVIEVTWYGAAAYCNWKSQQDGFTECYNLSDWSCDFNANGYRLPTEAEWEYAARGGENWEDNYKYSGTTDDLGDYAWYSSNSSSQTHEVGTKLPNQLNIYDMSGNVWEWCNDWYDSSYYSSSPATNPTGPASGSNRVLRGGGWGYGAGYCRVANRNDNNPTNSLSYRGFRILRTP